MGVKLKGENMRDYKIGETLKTKIGREKYGSEIQRREIAGLQNWGDKKGRDKFESEIQGIIKLRIH